MKILYVTALMETINAFLVPHIEMLLKKGNIVECACNENTNINKKLSEKNVKVNNINFGRNPLKINYKKIINQIRVLQEENNYDVIHVHTPIAAFLTRFALKDYKCKIIYTVHGLHFYEGAPLSNWIIYYSLEKIAARWTDLIITINYEDYLNCKKFKLRDEKSQVKLINGVGIDLNKYKIIDDGEKKAKREELNFSNDDFIIIMIADLNKNKNQIQLIKAMEIIKKKYDDIKVMIVGKGPMEEYLYKEIKERNLDDSIKLLGYREDINELINISNAGILLSYREGLPRNVMELMACGKPIIGTNIRGIRDLIKDGINGYLVNVNDIKDTANKIEKLYINSKETKIMSEKSIEYIQNYSIDKILEDLKEIYL
ncbi:glycosyltransferase family 4 protein [Clostridium perfringens]|uniref:glycosyltransferase family 4 protein n=1 Tax=Clostridium perfringens TaxID=1502 RepID=UPI0024BC8487|nr:glycosyltransferase family 4 protein [Clostridium perfringens]